MAKPNARSPSLTSQESYSTIIIGDMIADVPVPAEPQPENSNQKPKIEETNFGFDGTMDGGAPGAEMIMVINGPGGGGLSKGVILNAVNFGQADSKTKISDKVTEPVKKEEPSFKNMTMPRKILFGFSFLPSIMFVLCFAVILPCNVPLPCVKHDWIMTFNDTEQMSPLQQFREYVMLTVTEAGQHFLVTLSRTNGTIMNREKIDHKPRFLHCINDTMCIVLDDGAKIYGYDVFGKFSWSIGLPEEYLRPSLPFFLPDCNGSGVPDFAVALQKQEKSKVTFRHTAPEFIFSNFFITNCDSLPEMLTSWTTNNSTDLIFICKDNGTDLLMKIPQEQMCNAEEPDKNATVLFSRDSQSNTFNEYILEAFEDSLLLWVEDQVFLFQNESIKWTFRTSWHPNINRFVLGGKFNSENMEIALFSSDFGSNLMVTVLNINDGSIVTNKTLDYGATQGKVIHGKDRDFVLLLLQKVKKDLKTEALKQISGISSTVISLISNEEMIQPLNQFAKDTSEEIALMDMIAKFSPHSLRNRDEAFQTTLSAHYDESGDVLNVYLVTSLKDSGKTEISKLKISNWDLSALKAVQCSAS